MPTVLFASFGGDVLVVDSTVDSVNITPAQGRIKASVHLQSTDVTHERMHRQRLKPHHNVAGLHLHSGKNLPDVRPILTCPRRATYFARGTSCGAKEP